MTSLHNLSLFHLDDLALRRIIDYLSVEDVKNLAQTSNQFECLLEQMFTVTLPFPLPDLDRVDTDIIGGEEKLEKPVLEIVVDEETDKDSKTITRKQVGKININDLKKLWMECKNVHDESCVKSCSDYHQRILYNIYHRYCHF